MTIPEMQAALNELETEASEMRRAVHEGIAAARTINGNVRVMQSKLQDLDAKSANVRATLKAAAKAEQERLAAEAQAAAKAAADAQAAAEAAKE